MILFCTILASGMAFLDGTVVNVAIPTMQKALHTTMDSMQWVLNSYALLLAALILISGSLGDHFGRKKIFLGGIALFSFASFLCSIAASVEMLILFRAIQGIGAAMMIPGSLSIINASFNESHRGRAIGLWSGLAGGVAVLGPFVGGWLLESFGWPSIFLINIPLGILAFFLTLKYVPESQNHESMHLDFTGTVLIFLSLLGFCFGLIEAPVLGWNNPFVYGSIVLGLGGFVAFFFAERRTRSPIVPFKLFVSPLVTGANLVTLFLYFGLNSFILFLVLNFQQLQQYSPLFAGMGMLPTILLITFLSGPAGALADKIGPRIPMIVGPFIVTIAMIRLNFSGKQANYWTDFVPGLVLFGIGMALVIAPLTKSALSVDQKFSGAASGINNAVARVAALLSVALLGIVLIPFFSMSLQHTLPTSGLNQTQQQQLLEQKNKLGSVDIPETFSARERLIARYQIDEALLYSFRWGMGINAFLVFLSVLIAAATIHNPRKNHQ